MCVYRLVQELWRGELEGAKSLANFAKNHVIMVIDTRRFDKFN